MIEHGQRQGLDVFKAGIRPAMHQSAGLGGGRQTERRARAGPEAHAHRRLRLPGMRGIDDAGDVVRDDLGQEDPPCGGLDLRKGLTCDHGGHLRLHAELALGDDLGERRG